MSNSPFSPSTETISGGVETVVPKDLPEFKNQVQDIAVKTAAVDANQLSKSYSYQASLDGLDASTIGKTSGIFTNEAKQQNQLAAIDEQSSEFNQLQAYRKSSFNRDLAFKKTAFDLSDKLNNLKLQHNQDYFNEKLSEGERFHDSMFQLLKDNYEISRKSYRNEQKNGFWRKVIEINDAIAGAILGGPAGAEAGAQAGKATGNLIFGTAKPDTRAEALRQLASFTGTSVSSSVFSPNRDNKFKDLYNFAMAGANAYSVYEKQKFKGLPAGSGGSQHQSGPAESSDDASDAQSDDASDAQSDDGGFYSEDPGLSSGGSVGQAAQSRGVLNDLMQHPQLTHVMTNSDTRAAHSKLATLAGIGRQFFDSPQAHNAGVGFPKSTTPDELSRAQLALKQNNLNSAESYLDKNQRKKLENIQVHTAFGKLSSAEGKKLSVWANVGAQVLGSLAGVSPVRVSQQINTALPISQTVDDAVEQKLHIDYNTGVNVANSVKSGFSTLIAESKAANSPGAIDYLSSKAQANYQAGVDALSSIKNPLVKSAIQSSMASQYNVTQAKITDDKNKVLAEDQYASLLSAKPEILSQVRSLIYGDGTHKPDQNKANQILSSYARQSRKLLDSGNLNRKERRQLIIDYKQTLSFIKGGIQPSTNDSTPTLNSSFTKGITGTALGDKDDHRNTQRYIDNYINGGPPPGIPVHKITSSVYNSLSNTDPASLKQARIHNATSEVLNSVYKNGAASLDYIIKNSNDAYAIKVAEHIKQRIKEDPTEFVSKTSYNPHILQDQQTIQKLKSDLSDTNITQVQRARYESQLGAAESDLKNAHYSIAKKLGIPGSMSTIPSALESSISSAQAINAFNQKNNGSIDTSQNDSAAIHNNVKMFTTAHNSSPYDRQGDSQDAKLSRQMHFSSQFNPDSQSKTVVPFILASTNQIKSAFADYNIKNGLKDKDAITPSEVISQFFDSVSTDKINYLKQTLGLNDHELGEYVSKIGAHELAVNGNEGLTGFFGGTSGEGKRLGEYIVKYFNDRTSDVSKVAIRGTQQIPALGNLGKGITVEGASFNGSSADLNNFYKSMTPLNGVYSNKNDQINQSINYTNSFLQAEAIKNNISQRDMANYTDQSQWTIMPTSSPGHYILSSPIFGNQEMSTKDMLELGRAYEVLSKQRKA